MNIVENKNELIKHSAAVHINNTLSLMERKISNILLNQAQPLMEKRHEHIITIKEICKALNIPDNKNYEMIKNALRALSNTQVEWNILNKDKKNKWGISSILASVEIENGVCLYSYSAAMKKIFSSPNIYAKLNMAIQASFSSKYSIALWEYLMEFISSSSFKNRSNIFKNQISVDNLKKILGIESSKYYQEFSNFNREILKKSILEINSISDLYVELNFIKKGKKVEEIEFLVKKSKNSFDSQQFLNITTGSFVGVQDIFLEDIVTEMVEKFGFTELLAEKIVRDYGTKKVQEVIDYVIKQNPKYPAAYIRKALEENWVMTNSELTREIKEAEYKNIVFEEDSNYSDDPQLNEIMNNLKTKFGNDIFKAWFSDFISVSQLSDFKILIEIKNGTSFKEKWLKEHYGLYILNLCKNFFPEAVDIIFKSENAK